MRKFVAITFVLSLILSEGIVNAETTPPIDFAKNYGGSSSDNFYSINGTNDGNVIMSGYTSSDDYDLSANFGGVDAFLVKTDSNGNKIWAKNYGGSNHDSFYKVISSSDGGYIAVGYSYSTNYNITQPKGDADAIIAKISSNGTLLWWKNIGGTDYDSFYSVAQLDDGSFIAVGDSRSTNGDITALKGYYDAIMTKFDTNGNILWTKNLGGSEGESFFSITPTIDGGFVVSGESDSTNGDLTSNNGYYDAFIAKFDANGNKLWWKSYGGDIDDSFSSVALLPDGGYVASGYSYSSASGDIPGNKGTSGDFIVAMFDSSGNKIWLKNYGGSDGDYPISIVRMNDGNFLFVGYSNSLDGDIVSPKDPSGMTMDVVLIKIDGSGNVIWSKNIGGPNDDYIGDVFLKTNGDAFFAGSSSSVSGDVPSIYGADDSFLFKMTFPTSVSKQTLTSISIQGGSLSLTAPVSSVLFGNVGIDGSVKSVKITLGNLSFEDFRGTGEGYHLTMSSTQFTGTSSGKKLPTNALTLRGIQSINRVVGNTSLPASTIPGNTTIDSSGVKIISAASGSGMGKYTIVFPTDSLELAFDTSSMIADTYESTITWTLATGP